ncbi:MULTISPECIES: hypothetical protein [unclassified Bradyrhizobium]|uniref:hypothetical protein n=1 Tax=unclassified Bradyrhizobium TaxID=2631580 RepID=UPI002915CD27|nr:MULTISPECIES: hypothetical protein [unclassified Bradyrhizobium]
MMLLGDTSNFELDTTMQSRFWGALERPNPLSVNRFAGFPLGGPNNTRADIFAFYPSYVPQLGAAENDFTKAIRRTKEAGSAQDGIGRA